MLLWVFSVHCSIVITCRFLCRSGIDSLPEKTYFYSHHLWLPTQPSNNSFLTSWPIGGFPSPPIGDRLCRYSMPAAAGCWVIPVQPVFGERVLLGIHQRVFECLVTVGCHWCVPALWMSNVKTCDKKWSLQQQGSTLRSTHISRDNSVTLAMDCLSSWHHVGYHCRPLWLLQAWFLKW